MKKGTNIVFIYLKKILKDKKVTCMRLVSTINLLKIETYRVWVTIGRDRLEYKGLISIVQSALTIVKVHINSTILIYSM